MIVLAVVAALYVQHAIQLVTTHAQADDQKANVQQLARANAALRKQQQSLSNPVTIRNDARLLGMVQAGERPYVVMGLPHH